MIVVTAATGKLGRLTIDHLLARGVPAAAVTAAARSPQKAADLADRGIRVVQADYDDRASLEGAFSGAEKILLISSTAIGKRDTHIRTAAQAARKAGSPLLVYTSMVSPEGNPLALAEEHRASEQALRDSGLPFVLLRNGWYSENSISHATAAMAGGEFASNAGDGRIASATREDLAEAAAVVLTGQGHEGKVYELTGDTTWTMSDLAEELSRQTGRQVNLREVTDEDFHTILSGVGVPEPLAGMLVDANARIREGALAEVTDDLRTLLGRPTTGLADAVAGALKTSPAG